VFDMQRLAGLGSSSGSAQHHDGVVAGLRVEVGGLGGVGFVSYIRPRISRMPKPSIGISEVARRP